MSRRSSSDGRSRLASPSGRGSASGSQGKRSRSISRSVGAVGTYWLCGAPGLYHCTRLLRTGTCTSSGCFRRSSSRAVCMNALYSALVAAVDGVGMWLDNFCEGENEGIPP